MVLAWQSETLWTLLGTIAVIWFIGRHVLAPLSQIERIRRDLEAIRDHLQRGRQGNDNNDT
jgi:hypothetical protein